MGRLDEVQPPQSLAQRIALEGNAGNLLGATTGFNYEILQKTELDKLSRRDRQRSVWRIGAPDAAAVPGLAMMLRGESA